MNIRFLGAHNCESQSTKFVSLLVDDILAIDAGGLTSRLSFEAQQKLKAVLLTHQHYDHVRDIPALGMNFYLHDATINVYSTQPVYDALAAHLLNSELYPNFLEKPPQNPAIKFNIIEPHCTEQIEGYSILATKVNHSVPTVGYQVASPDGKTLFYTADTGPGLAECWKQVSPQLLIIETSWPNRYEDFAKKTGHLTPNLLEQELVAFRELKGYLPQVVTVHMFPHLEEEIRTELAVVAKALNHPITLAYEGMEIDL
jgi:ribonuclease BN (tRNA processing enzyme)